MCRNRLISLVTAHINFEVQINCNKKPWMALEETIAQMWLGQFNKWPNTFDSFVFMILQRNNPIYMFLKTSEMSLYVFVCLYVKRDKCRMHVVLEGFALLLSPLVVPCLCLVAWLSLSVHLQTQCICKKCCVIFLSL